MFALKTVFSLSILFVVRSESDDIFDNVIVRINTGYLKGEVMTSENGEPFFAFRGIPYAEPPVGELRFKPPVSKTAWEGVRNATSDGPRCPQIDFRTQTYYGSEDCLFLNVYTQKLPEKNDTKRDVVYFIHGGGFIGGAAGALIFGPRRFPLKNIILVTIAYRLSALGFLTTKDSESPGNYGLMDQLEGLRWIRDNIGYFGGDPNKVTLMGQSSGSVCVLYHVLSALSEGLFHRAIALSGSPVTPYAFQKDPIYWTRKLARDLSCPIEDSEQLVACLKNKSAEEIIEHSIEREGGNVLSTFAPTVDNYFIMDTPLNLFKKGSFQKNIPIMMGGTKGEAQCWMSGKNNSETFTDDEIMSIFRITVDVRPNVSQILEEIKENYFSQIASCENEIVQEIIRKAMTAGRSHIPVYYNAKLMMDFGIKLFLYEYDYFAPWFNESDHPDVCHSDDLFLLFDGRFRVDSFDERSERMKENYQKLITDFIQFGNPTPIDSTAEKWPPCERDDLYLYHINENSSVEHYDHSTDDAYKFWTHIFEQLNGKTKTCKKY